MILLFLLFLLLSPGSELHRVMVPAAKAAFSFHIPKRHPPGFGYEIQHCTCHGWFLYRWVRNLSLMSFMNHLDFLCTACVLFLEHSRTVEVLQGLWTHIFVRPYPLILPSHFVQPNSANERRFKAKKTL